MNSTRHAGKAGGRNMTCYVYLLSRVFRRFDGMVELVIGGIHIKQIPAGQLSGRLYQRLKPAIWDNLYYLGSVQRKVLNV